MLPWRASSQGLQHANLCGCALLALPSLEQGEQTDDTCTDAAIAISDGLLRTDDGARLGTQRPLAMQPLALMAAHGQAGSMGQADTHAMADPKQHNPVGTRQVGWDRGWGTLGPKWVWGTQTCMS